MKKKILILGTRTFAVELVDVITEIKSFEVAGFVENMDEGRSGQLLDDIPVFWIDALTGLSKTHYAVCGLATPHHRRRFVDTATEYGISFVEVIHPFSRVSSKSTLCDQRQLLFPPDDN